MSDLFVVSDVDNFTNLRQFEISVGKGFGCRIAFTVTSNRDVCLF